MVIPVWRQTLYARFYVFEVKETDTAVDPTDDEFRAAFLRYAREKNGSGLSAVEQLDRLNAEFPLLNMKYLLLNMEGGIC